MATSSKSNGSRQKVVAQEIAKTLAKEVAEEGPVDEAPLPQISVDEALKINFGFLNDEQNIFLREYFKNGRNGLIAFRIAYPNNKSNDETARVRVYQMLKSASISMAVSQIERAALQGIVLTLQEHLTNLATLRDEAKKVRQYGAAVSAEVNRGKASGLYVTRTEITGKDGSPLAVSAVSTEEYIAARQKLLTEV